MRASKLIEYLITAYDLKYEGTCDGTKDSFRIGVSIGNKPFFGLIKEDQLKRGIPLFDLMVDLSEGLIIRIQFHRYKCFECGITSTEKDDQQCDCESICVEILSLIPPNMRIDLSTIGIV